MTGNFQTIAEKGFAFLLTLLFVSCGGSSSKDETSSGPIASYEDKVILRSQSDPSKLNPYNASDAEVTYMIYHVFQTLVNVNFENNELVPVLAMETAKFRELEGNRVAMDYEIRPEAKWDNGKDITGADVAFSVKVFQNPKVDNPHYKPLFEFMEDVILDEANPKKFSIICKYPYMVAEVNLTEFPIIPAYVYDPEGLMETYTVKQVSMEGKKLQDDENMVKFAEFFNGQKFEREVMIGSGAYDLDKWETNQRVVFTKKENWWGDKLAKEHNWFEANTKKLVYEVINDPTTALVAMKGEKVDVYRSISPRDFVKDLKVSKDFGNKFNLHTPSYFSYDYIGMNQRSPKFSDIRVRKAFSHVMNVDKLIETVCYGLGERVTGPTHPSNPKFYNGDVVPYAYDLEKAKTLMTEAGWKDTDGDGLLDKEIDGEVEQFETTILYNQGNKRRETACLLLQESARKIGVKINIQVLDWSVFLDRTKTHNFDMYVGGWVSSPLESDPMQIWHTESYNGGSNYVGFGNPETDVLIEDLRSELDVEKRSKLTKQLHKVIHDDAPYIFLMAQKERIAIHKKFTNAEAYGMRPGFWMQGFQGAKPIAN